MKTIYDIAKNELKTLFFSPVAWFILIVFTIQAITSFTHSTNFVLRFQEMGWGRLDDGMTFGIFAHGIMGFLRNILQYLYLYIPLLTMGLISRELGSGSIKLLYSSPVSNFEIILGKYISMMIYGLALMVVMLFIILFTACFIPHFDYKSTFTAVLGFYLLICTYAAIGLFMSSLTSYQIVAAIMTLAMLAVLDSVKNWGQEYELMRDIAYWLSISGRAEQFITGLICSEDVLYFIIVSFLFLTLSIITLNAKRQKTRWTTNISKYAIAIGIACFWGYLTSLPSMRLYYDASANDRNTLTKNSQDVVSKLNDGLTITMYANALGNDFRAALSTFRMYDKDFWAQYTRFNPYIKFKYVLYYDSIPGQDLSKQFPGKILNTLREQKNEICRINGVDSTLFMSPEEIRKQIDLSPENNKFVRLLETNSGKRTFLRMFNDPTHVPTEAEITAAIKRLVMDLPTIGFATGQGERVYDSTADHDYNFAIQKNYRYALINQGFEVMQVNFAESIPEHVNIVVIAEMKRPFNEQEQANFDKYLARGGNLCILTEPRRKEAMQRLLATFGVSQDDGVLVNPFKKFTPDFLRIRPTSQATEKFYQLDGFEGQEFITMTSASPISYETNRGYEIMPLLQTDSLAWNELQTTDFIDDSCYVDTSAGEIQQRYVTGLALHREINKRTQKIVILSDADCLSNKELNSYRSGITNRNFQLINAMFFWMSDEEVPIDIRRPQTDDTVIKLTKEKLEAWKYLLHWGIPCALILTYLIMWIRRRNR